MKSQTVNRLVDALFAHGDAASIAERVDAHMAAGADHVCLQVVGPKPRVMDVAVLRPAWRTLAQSLIK